MPISHDGFACAGLQLIAPDVVGKSPVLCDGIADTGGCAVSTLNMRREAERKYRMVIKWWEASSRAAMIAWCLGSVDILSVDVEVRVELALELDGLIWYLQKMKDASARGSGEGEQNLY